MTCLVTHTVVSFSGVHDMVCANSDYLVNAISLRLRHIERYPTSPYVLQSVLQHTNSNVLPLFEDIIQEVSFTDVAFFQLLFFFYKVGTNLRLKRGSFSCNYDILETKYISALF